MVVVHRGNLEWYSCKCEILVLLMERKVGVTFGALVHLVQDGAGAMIGALTLGVELRLVQEADCCRLLFLKNKFKKVSLNQ